MTITHKSFQNGLSPPVRAAVGKKTSWARNLPRSPRHGTSILYCEIMCEWESAERKQPEAGLILEMPQERNLWSQMSMTLFTELMLSQPVRATLLPPWSLTTLPGYDKQLTDSFLLPESKQASVLQRSSLCYMSRVNVEVFGDVNKSPNNSEHGKLPSTSAFVWNPPRPRPPPPLLLGLFFSWCFVWDRLHLVSKFPCEALTAVCTLLWNI